ncbi:MAG: Inward rectifier potassium channel kirbac3 [Chitinophagaceae bacterium]|nr:Inward rectifier potassium channel kirbac3 [Chitinophagaceae bacterium]
MAILNRINRRAIENTETGFGTNSAYSGGRFFLKDGTPNMRIRGVSVFKRVSIYQSLLKLSLFKFLSVIVLLYLVVNLCFATIYYLIGLDNLGGMDSHTINGRFWEAFFFSAQTLSTVGYGHVYPSGHASNIIAAIECLLGLLMFALATGLMYGRFSQPKPYIHYSKHALLAPFKDGMALMFRMAPYKRHFLTDVEVKVTAGMKLLVDGVRKNQFYTLPLAISRANSLTLNWTIVHPINEESPLFSLTKEEILEAETELLVFVKGFDEEYSNTVVSKTSYTTKEVVFGAKFKVMYRPSDDGTHTIMDLRLLDDYEHAELPQKI